MAPIRRSQRIQRRQEAAANSENISIAAVAPVVETPANELAEPERDMEAAETTRGLRRNLRNSTSSILRILRRVFGFHNPESVSDECRRRATTILLRELQNFQRNPLQNCAVELDEENIFRWNVTMPGTAGTPYENGVFRVVILFPGDYPVTPPHLLFKTKIFHCNISDQGTVCMDTLQDKWNPLQTVQSVVLCLQILMAEPNPDGAFKSSMGALYKNEREQYDAKARLWTNLYAKP